MKGTEREPRINPPDLALQPVRSHVDVTSQAREGIDSRRVEVRLGDPRTDAPRLLELFQQPSTIEHIAGIKPDTSVKEILQLYRGSDVLLTAETPEGKIIGTITVQRPGFGTNFGSLARIAVDENHRRQGVAKKLVKAANAVLFSSEELGGFDCKQGRAAVILGVAGYWKAQDLFESEGYIRGAEIEESTKGWDNRFKRMIDNRNVQPMFLKRRDYKKNRQGEHIKYFPKPRPFPQGFSAESVVF